MAALGCAIFNGIAAILEKIGANQQRNTRTILPNLIWKLRTNIPYLLGIIFDLLAWLLTLYAVHNLPLFIVQPIIACSIIVTIVIEYFLFEHPINIEFIFSLVVIILGLLLLAIISSPEKSSTISSGVKYVVLFGPFLLLIIGALATFKKNKYSMFVLAIISGLAFGGVSISGRAVSLSAPYFHILTFPLFWSIIGYGLVGIVFFTAALQKSTATSVSASMIAGETILPIIFGISFLGDHPKNNLWIILIVGVVLTSIGTIYIALNSETNLADH
jgi:drug/metabolite transporter (DMT)-like permease